MTQKRAIRMSYLAPTEFRKALDYAQRVWSVSAAEPADIPVTLAQLRDHMRIITDPSTSPETSPDDTKLQLCGDVATRAAEDYTETYFYTRTVTCRRDEFERVMYLPVWPVQSVDAVKYNDADSVEQTIASSNYKVDTNSQPARIVFNDSFDFPSTDEKINAVTVEVTAGYGEQSDIPDAIKGAILLHAGTLFEHRESVIAGTTAAAVPHALERLLWPYRRLGL